MDDPGFEVVQGVLTPGECDDLLRMLSCETTSRSRAGTRHLMAHPAIRTLAYRKELLTIARRCVGPGAVPFRATLFEKSGVHNWLVVWHQDTTLPLAARTASSEWGPWSVKNGVRVAHAPSWALTPIVALRIHLDAAGASNGPLRVLPRTHAAGVLSCEEVFRKARETTPVECLVGRGGVLLMRPLLIHASSKARSPEPRRVLHLEYAASLELRDGLRLVVT